jgi:hypothetical protein
MDFAPAVSAKPTIFTRIYLAAGLLLFSRSPLALAIVLQIGADSSEVGDFETAAIAIVALQGLLWFTIRRCGTADRPYWRSLVVIAILAISLSCALAFTKSAPERMSRLVYWFYDHRMHQ